MQFKKNFNTMEASAWLEIVASGFLSRSIRHHCEVNMSTWAMNIGCFCLFILLVIC